MSVVAEQLGRGI